MSDLIGRNDAAVAACDACYRMFGEEPCWDSECLMKRRIDEVRAVDAVPVAHGGWMLVGEGDYAMKCTNCKEVFFRILKRGVSAPTAAQKWMEVNNMKKIITIAILGCLVMALLTGCTEADRVNENLRIQADNFNVTRQITVFNTRTDKVLFQMTGLMSLSNNINRELQVTCEVGNGIYKKHFIYLSDETTYIVEDVTGAFADKYHYELNILPEMLVPVTVTAID